MILLEVIPLDFNYLMMSIKKTPNLTKFQKKLASMAKSHDSSAIISMKTMLKKTHNKSLKVDIYCAMIRTYNLSHVDEESWNHSIESLAHIARIIKHCDQESTVHMLISIVESINKVFLQEDSSIDDPYLVEFLKIVNGLQSASQFPFARSAFATIRLMWLPEHDINELIQCIKINNVDSDVMKAKLIQIFKISQVGNLRETEKKILVLEEQIKQCNDQDTLNLFKWAILHLGVLAFNDGLFEYSYKCISPIIESSDETWKEMVFIPREIIELCYYLCQLIINSDKYQQALTSYCNKRGQRECEPTSVRSMILNIGYHIIMSDVHTCNIWILKLVEDPVWEFFDDSEYVGNFVLHALSGKLLVSYLKHIETLSTIGSFRKTITLSEIEDGFYLDHDMIVPSVRQIIFQDKITGYWDDQNDCLVFGVDTAQNPNPITNPNTKNGKTHECNTILSLINAIS